MHLGNGIICPVTGIPMILASSLAAIYAFKKARMEDLSKDRIILIATLTSFVFALQMINFAIPSTGSSGHIVGGVLLATLLGANTGFLAICVIFLVQALFFADGGILAIGCNIFNMGFLACYVAYPLIFKPFAKKNMPFIGAIIASIVALQAGSLAIVIEGVLSGSIKLLNSGNFALMMQLIHLPIGLVEGIVTGGVVAIAKQVSQKSLYFAFGAVSFILACIISKYASSKPDGLEWSLLNISDSCIIQSKYTLYSIIESIQTKIAVLSSIQPVIANFYGLVILYITMFGLCKMLSFFKEVNEC